MILQDLLLNCAKLNPALNQDKRQLVFSSTQKMKQDVSTAELQKSPKSWGKDIAQGSAFFHRLCHQEQEHQRQLRERVAPRPAWLTREEISAHIFVIVSIRSQISNE